MQIQKCSCYFPSQLISRFIINPFPLFLLDKQILLLQIVFKHSIFIYLG